MGVSNRRWRYEVCEGSIGGASPSKERRCSEQDPKFHRLKVDGCPNTCVLTSPNIKMFSALFDLVSDYATPYDAARTTYLADAQALKEATGPYKAARDAYVAATATYTKSLYE
jgi:hypothetical protein